MAELQVFPRRAPRALALAAALLLAASLLGACGERSSQAAEQKAPPPPEVGVVTVEPTTVTVTTDLPGRLEPVRVAQVRARVDGILLKRAFDEGSDVKKGQTLYHIDPAPYEAALQSAAAQVAQAQAQLADASATVRRYKPLVAAHAVSAQQYDAAVAAEKSAQAQVAAGKAAVRTANINLAYTKVTAPISGHIGRSLVTEGALMSAAQGTEMAVIQQIDELYVNITQPAMAVLQLREALRAGTIERSGQGEAAKVEIILDNGQAYGHAGKLLFTDVTVDPTTGQVGLRATVSNPDGLLLPGMYVRARLQQAQYDHAVLLPQQALSLGGKNGASVLVVAEDGSFAPRAVKLGPAQGNQWVVLGGLEPGDKVLVNGQSKLMPGVTKVRPVPYEAGDAAGSSGGSNGDQGGATPADPPASEGAKPDQRAQADTGATAGQATAD